MMFSHSTRTIIRPLCLVRNIFLRDSKKFSHVDEISHKLKHFGYRSETHIVKTEDGYILKVNRILPKKHSSHKGTIFLMHGLLRNSSDFIASGPKNALAYYLSDNGFDVWLGNARGTKYSNEHVTLTQHSKEFWNFSFHEIGLHDVSTMMSFMLDHTKDDKTNYVGHSQGTCSLLALLSSLPHYNEKIKQAHLITPAVFMRHSPSPLLTMPAKHSGTVMNYAHKIGKIDISPMLKISHKLCNFNGYNRNIATRLYKNLTCMMIGTNKKELEVSDEALMSFHVDMSPAVSMMQLTHFLQLHVSGKFQQYDHGDRNHSYYDSAEPPEYELQKVTAPMHLYSASKDLLISPKDVEHLMQKLPNAQRHHILQDWNHMDVILGRNSRKLLYKNILAEISTTN